MQPESLRKRYKEQHFQLWFQRNARDLDGELSIDEYLLWTLENALVRHGEAALREVFSLYDPDGSGELNASEFQRGRMHCPHTALKRARPSYAQAHSPSS